MRWRHRHRHQATGVMMAGTLARRLPEPAVTATLTSIRHPALQPHNRAGAAGRRRGRGARPAGHRRVARLDGARIQYTRAATTSAFTRNLRARQRCLKLSPPRGSLPRATRSGWRGDRLRADASHPIPGTMQRFGPSGDRKARGHSADAVLSICSTPMASLRGRTPGVTQGARTHRASPSSPSLRPDLPKARGNS